jgi:hypothetical protein
MSRRWPALIPAVVLLAAACGGGGSGSGVASLQGGGDDAGSSTTAAAAAVDPEQAMLDFTACMREHGVDMADPQVDSANGGFAFSFGAAGPGDGSAPDNAEMEKMRAASESCSQYLEGVVQQFERPDMSEMQDTMLAFAQCMRDNGVDMPDPDFSSDGPAFQVGPGGGDQSLDPGDPTFQAAQEACSEIFGGGPSGGIIVRGSGGGPGGESGGNIIVGPGGPGSGGSDNSSGGG